jgi:hypothetical protein
VRGRWSISLGVRAVQRCYLFTGALGSGARSARRSRRRRRLF